MTKTYRTINFLFFLSACISIISCKPKEPNNHLSPVLMQKLLLDVNMAETYSTFQKDSLHKQGGKNMDSLAAHYKDILAHYKLSPEEFAENLEWYKDHPDDLDSIYDDMIPIATKIQTAVTPLMPAAPAAPALPVALPGKK